MEIAVTRKIFADDPIPSNAVTLSEAFPRIVKALSAKPELIEETLKEYNLDWKHDLEKMGQRFLRFREESAANAFFRCHLIWGITKRFRARSTERI